jgi:hypothetical protein
MKSDYSLKNKKVVFVRVSPDRIYISWDIWTADGDVYNDIMHRRFGLFNPFKLANVREFMKTATCTKQDGFYIFK